MSDLNAALNSIVIKPSQIMGYYGGITDNFFLQFVADSSATITNAEIDLNFALDVFGNWENGKIGLWVDDTLKAVLSFDGSALLNDKKVEWNSYGVCTDCENQDNKYSTIVNLINWTQMQLNSFSCKYNNQSTICSISYVKLNHFFSLFFFST